MARTGADGGYSRVASGTGAADGSNTRLSLTSCVVSAVDGRTVSRPLPIVYMCSDRHNQQGQGPHRYWLLLTSQPNFIKYWNFNNKFFTKSRDSISRSSQQKLTVSFIFVDGDKWETYKCVYGVLRCFPHCQGKKGCWLCRLMRLGAARHRQQVSSKRGDIDCGVQTSNTDTGPTNEGYYDQPSHILYSDALHDTDPEVRQYLLELATNPGEVFTVGALRPSPC